MPCCGRLWKIKYVLSGDKTVAHTQIDNGDPYVAATLAQWLIYAQEIAAGTSYWPPPVLCTSFLLCPFCVCACVCSCVTAGGRVFQDELLKPSLACLTRADRYALACSLLCSFLFLSFPSYQAVILFYLFIFFRWVCFFSMLFPAPLPVNTHMYTETHTDAVQ